MTGIGVAAAALAATPAFFLKSGDRVLFYGDSITEHQRYTACVEAFTLARYPNLKVSFMGAGWAGDTIYGGSKYWDESGGDIAERVLKDVKPRNPSVVTVMLGMNDAYYSPYREEWHETFKKDYSKMLDMLQGAAPKARFALLSPSPWDDFTRPPSFPAGIQGEGGYNSSLVRYGDGIKEEAAKRAFGFVDVNRGMSQGLVKAAKSNKDLAQKLISDWIHPDWPGAVLMAAVILKGWGAEGVVSETALDLKAGKVSAEGAQVRNLRDLQWEQKDLGLPFPYDPSVPVEALAAEASGIPDELDIQSVRVIGLKEGLYRLDIDGQAVLTASSQAFSEGLRLSGLNTPMRSDSLEALKLVKLKNRLQQARWREVERQTDPTFSKRGTALQAMMDLESEVISKAREIVKPKWRRWSLTPVS